MCGIVGVASTEPIADRKWLSRGIDLVRHRGPDDFGEYWSAEGNLGLGHRRLSILDLSSDGRQPMSSADGKHAIVFNGEIYNFQDLAGELREFGANIRSGTDTEVVLHAYRQWGERCVEHFQGMFAFAVYDRDRNVLFCARDRAGEKPFFYHFEGGTLRFASEMKAILADPRVPRRVDHAALDYYLAYGYVPGEETILQGILKLPPAHVLRLELATGRLDVWRYWDLPPWRSSELVSISQLEFELERLLEDAVRRQLVADVPVGVLLSGGVDSSLVVAMAARHCARVKTFTVGFRDSPDYDETAHAKLIADEFHTEHTVLSADSITVELLPKLAAQYDEPMVDSSMIPTFLISEQISKRCKVALGGDGADELFGGYYSASRMAQLSRWMPKWSLPLRRFSATALGAVLPNSPRIRRTLRQLESDTTVEVPAFMQKFEPVQRRRLMSAFNHWRTVAERRWNKRIPFDADAVQRVTRFDFGNYLAEDILVKVDRASMLNSLEVRSPFLHVPLLEFAFGKVPSSMKATPCDRKIILKQLAARLLPAGFDLKRKHGFGVPLGKWLRKGPWREFVEAVLLDTGCKFAPREVQRVLRSHDRNTDLTEELFGLCLFELWRREYGVSM